MNTKNLIYAIGHNQRETNQKIIVRQNKIVTRLLSLEKKFNLLAKRFGVRIETELEINESSPPTERMKVVKIEPACAGRPIKKNKHSDYDFTI